MISFHSKITMSDKSSQQKITFYETTFDIFSYFYLETMIWEFNLIPNLKAELPSQSTVV